MKKILAFAAVAVMAVAGAFALDLGEIKGTWQDKNWDANWTFAADGKIVLTKTNGEEVFTFDDTTVNNFKPVVNSNGVGFSFYCKETERSYQFLKPITLSTDLSMTVNPDWTDTDYTVAIELQK